MKKVYILLKDKVLDIDVIRELHNTYTITNNEKKADLIIDGFVITSVKNNFDIDCEHWLNGMKSYTEVIENILKGISISKDYMIL